MRSHLHEQLRLREREGERGGKNSFISCTSGLELHLELITPAFSPPPSPQWDLTAAQPGLPHGRHRHPGLCGDMRTKAEALIVSRDG